MKGEKKGRRAFLVAFCLTLFFTAFFVFAEVNSTDYDETPSEQKSNEIELALDTNETNDTEKFEPGYLESEDDLEPIEMDIQEPLSDRLTKSQLEKVDEQLWDSTNNTTVRVLIQFEISNSKEDVEEIVQDGELRESRNDKLVYAELPLEEIEKIVKEGGISKIWLDSPTSSFLDQSSAQIGVPDFWPALLNGTNITVAILDSGIETTHEMFDGTTIVSQDFTGDGVTDNFGHGTHVAGIVAGHANYTGIAPSVRLLNGKVLDDNGQGYLSWLIEGIEWAQDPDNNPSTDDGADIISLSLGATYSGDAEDFLDAPEVETVESAIAAGTVVVIASGNCRTGCGGFTGVTSPGIAPNAITIGAVHRNNSLASFSSGQAIADYVKPDLVAPGVDICSAYLSGYVCLSGTSMATPHVAGTAALLLDQDPSLSPSALKTILEESATDLGTSGKDSQYGSGLVNVTEALELLNTDLPIISELQASGDIQEVTVAASVQNADSVVLTLNHGEDAENHTFNDSFVYSFIPKLGENYLTVTAANSEGVSTRYKTYSVYNYNIFVPATTSSSEEFEITIDYFNTENNSQNVSASVSLEEFSETIQQQESQIVTSSSAETFQFPLLLIAPGEYYVSITLADETGTIQDLKKKIKVIASPTEQISPQTMRFQE